MTKIDNRIDMNCLKNFSNQLSKHETTMTDLTMILLALGMVAVFMSPFFVISAIKDRKEAKQKQEENEEK